MRKPIWIALLIALPGCAGLMVLAQSSGHAQSEQAQIMQVKQAPQTQPPRLSRRDESFDAPLRKTVIDLGVSPYAAGDHPAHGELACYFFKGFMVKQLDLKQKGAEWIAIAPAGDSGSPRCAREHGKGEKVIQNWAGYFAGVKGNLIFLNGDDGFNGGYPFGVFDSATGKKLFADSRDLAGKELQFVRDGQRLAVRYRRVYSAECSIPGKKEACWEEIERKVGLASQPMPACVGYDSQVGETDPSVISYPVEVTLLPEIHRRQISGPVKCWAAQ
jgi:hypothetical protein